MSDPTRVLPERRVVRAALRTVLSDRQTRALLLRGWSALVGETQAELDELREELAEIHNRFSKSLDAE